MATLSERVHRLETELTRVRERIARIEERHRTLREEVTAAMRSDAPTTPYARRTLARLDELQRRLAELDRHVRVLLKWASGYDR